MTIDFTNERTARIALAHAAPLGDTLTQRLITEHGCAETVDFALTGHRPAGISELGFAAWQQHVASLLTEREIERVFAKTAIHELTVLTPDAPEWQTSGITDLRHRTPLALWAQGNTALLTIPLEQRVTITGARAATRFGTDLTREITTDLADTGHLTVSSASYGIDAESHRAALDSGLGTIAVLAGGLERLYPAGHQDLFDQIRERGLILSEASPAQVPTRRRYEQRGRVLTALTAATVIIEAGVRSGTLLLADEAQSLRKPIGAVSGPDDSPASAGCHRLIAERGATPITSAGDVRQMIQPSVTCPPTPERAGRSSSRRNPLPSIDKIGRSQPGDDPTPGITR